MIKILFICHGSILKNPGKVYKINDELEAVDEVLRHYSKRI